ncbi:MAG: methionine--tRNA ligase [Propionibacteriaceae bacterium]
MAQHIFAGVAWPYANGPRHIGHVSGFGVPSDVFARYMRMTGNNVLMVSGSDCHGTAMQVKADSEGLTAAQVAAKYHEVNVRDLQGLGCTYDLFTNTMTKNHAAVVQDVFLAMYRNGYIVSKIQKGAIDPTTGRTLADRYIEGTCPLCGDPGARGDQCDTCGSQLDPSELINPRSRTNGAVPQFIDTEHLFIDLPSFQQSLTHWLQTRQDWRPNVLKFSQNFIDDLKPRAITRDLDWGITVPLGGWEDQPMKRFYVWFDAVIGYLSASIEWAQRTGQPDAWKDWWLNTDAKSFYYMGKDNITFHSVVWPSILLGHNGSGDKGGECGRFGQLELPGELVSSEYLTQRGSKVSSSRGANIYVGPFLEEFGADALRYFISVAGPESHDTDFTWDEFVRRTNFELANEWGNLVNRSISMAHKNNGAIPPVHELHAEDVALRTEAAQAFTTMGQSLQRNKFKQSISEAMRIVGLANKYISDMEPWKLKEDTDRRDTVLNTALQVVSDCNTMLTPFLPHSSQKIFEALGGEGVWAAQSEIQYVDEGGEQYPILMGDYTKAKAVWGHHEIVAGTPLEKPSPLFTKLDETLGQTGPQWAPIAE